LHATYKALLLTKLFNDAKIRAWGSFYPKRNIRVKAALHVRVIGPVSRLAHNT